MRLRQIVFLAAGLLITLRLFFPVTDCTYFPRRMADSTCTTAGSRPGILRVMTSATMLQALGIAALAAAIVLGTSRKGGDSR